VTRARTWRRNVPVVARDSRRLSAARVRRGQPDGAQPQQRGLAARAAYKLIEIARRDALLAPGATVVDVGAAPGGWSQVAAERVGRGGRVIAVDLLDMAPIAGVEFLQGDFLEEAMLARIDAALGHRPVDLVLSDLAPNLSGVKVSDQARSMLLAETVARFAQPRLAPGGRLLLKVFQGAGIDALRRQLRSAFGWVETRKPDASRERSAEIYLLAGGGRRGRS
jgi:23S rRNA (uridine2552-2'-O)-methyltransferase